MRSALDVRLGNHTSIDRTLLLQTLSVANHHDERKDLEELVLEVEDPDERQCWG